MAVEAMRDERFPAALLRRFRRLHMPPSVLAALVAATLLILVAALANVIAPHDPYDLATLDLASALTPPAWEEGGNATYLLGTDDQGRDVLSTIFFGLRVSLLVGTLSVVVSVVLGGILGLVAGYAGGWVDMIIMRLADVQSSFTALLIALLVDGVFRAALGGRVPEQDALVILVFSIGLSYWVQYARTTRAATMIEKNKDYVNAAIISGVSSPRILLTHILPNVIGPLLVLAAVNSALAISTEAVLSFLGVGVSPDKPSLGSLIRTGNDFLLAGQWWVGTFASLVLVVLVLCINVLGDWLRASFDPQQRREA